MAGILILTLPFKYLYHNLSQVIGRACIEAPQALYVHFDSSSFFSSTHEANHLSIKEASYVIQNVYTQTLSLAPHLDVRVIMQGFKGNAYIPSSMKYPIEHFMVDYCVSEQLSLFNNKYSHLLKGKSPLILLEDHKEQECVLPSLQRCKTDKVYKEIVAGGTFDRIHIGHKILVSEGLLRCSRKFTIGMADGELLAKKTLTELIEPVQTRIDNLLDLLEDIDPTVEYRLEPIYEPCGPSVEDANMEMIIVSQETLKGGNFVNKVRAERNLRTLDVSVIELVDDPKRNSVEETKVSSSSVRMRLLGTLIKPRKNIDKDSGSPFIVGLTGGSCSGKTTLARKIANLEASVIDCDKLGHEAYIKGSVCYHKMVETFGDQILTEDKQINRKALGEIVFKDEKKMKQLTNLVWPEIYSMVEKKISQLKEAGKSLVFLDAAVLLEANWDKFCNEVWVCMVPPAEAIRRICERDSCSEDLAKKRLSNQLSNKVRIDAANVVICSLWDSNYTEEQLKTAWERLKMEGVARSSSTMTKL